MASRKFLHIKKYILFFLISFLSCFLLASAEVEEEYEHARSHCGVDSIVSPEKKLDLKSKLKKASKTSFFKGTVAKLTKDFKVATILVNIDGEAPKYKELVLKSKLVSGQQNVKDHINYSSRGNVNLNFDSNSDGDVDTFGPVNITVESDFCRDPNLYAKKIISELLILQEGLAANTEGEEDTLIFDEKNYDIVTFIIPRQECGWDGLANLNCANEPNDNVCFVYNTRYTSIPIFSHEYGHTLGLAHSNSDFEKRPGKSSFSPYGDYSCTMGLTRNITNFNAVQQAIGGWLEESDMLEINKEGKFKLSSPDLFPKPNTLPLLANLKMNGSDDEFYISYRTLENQYNNIGETFDKKLSIYNSFGEVIDRLDLNDSFYELIDDDNYFEIKVTDISAESVEFEVSENEYSDKDDDGDLVNNFEELKLDSNPSDAGSFYQSTQSSGGKFVKYVLWNSFLGTFNYLELTNSDFFETIELNVTLISNNGAENDTKNYTIAPEKQLDIAVNTLDGFKENAYGLIRIESTLDVEGRSSFYKMDPTFSSYEFAYSLDFEKPLNNESVVVFNTTQPSVALAEIDLSVVNWLTLVNHSDRSERYRVISYGEEGNILRRETVSLPAFSRKDLDGGHGFAGKDAKGFHRIVPLSSNALYTAKLTRYGSGVNANEILFAFSQSSTIPSGEVQYLNLSDVLNEEKRLEIINASEEPQQINVELYDSAGNSLSKKSFDMKGLSQLEIRPGEIHPERGSIASFGLVEITPEIENSISAQVTKYFKGNVTSGMKALFSNSASEVYGSGFTGSYNLFLNMDNKLRLLNTSDEEVGYLMFVSTPYGSVPEFGFIGPKSARTITFNTNRYFSLGQISDTYGSVKLLTDNYGALKTEMVRFRTFTHPRALTEELEIAFPTKFN